MKRFFAAIGVASLGLACTDFGSLQPEFCAHSGAAFCSDSGAGADSGLTDSGTVDAGAHDAGASDAGVNDSGTGDAGVSLRFTPSSWTFAPGNWFPPLVGYVQVFNLVNYGPGTSGPLTVALSPVGNGYNYDLNSCDGGLVPGASCSVRVSLMPTSSGVKSVILSVSDGTATGTASITATAWTMSVNSAGDSTGGISVLEPAGPTPCVAPCSAIFLDQAPVTVSAAPALGSTASFSSNGVNLGSGVPAVLIAMTSDQAVTVDFERYNLAFVTSTPQSFSSTQEADNACTTLGRKATDGGVGNFLAWLPGDAGSPKKRISSARGWVRPDGLPVADSPVDLLVRGPFYPLRIAENGQDVSVRSVATATDVNGLATSDCADWTADAGTTSGGTSTAGLGEWTEDLSVPNPPCAGPHSLYCFQVDKQLALIVPGLSQTQKIVFVSQPFLPGPAAFPNDTCQQSVPAYKASSFFTAFLSSGGVPALQQLNINGPWYRLDGISIGDRAQLDAGPLAPMNLLADGINRYGGPVWTGATTPSDNTTPTCSDWTSTAGLTVGGDPARTDLAFLNAGSLLCDGGTFPGVIPRLYCFEE